MKSFKQIVEETKQPEEVVPVELSEAKSTGADSKALSDALDWANIALLKAISNIHMEFPTPQVKKLWDVASNDLHVAIGRAKKSLK